MLNELLIGKLIIVLIMQKSVDQIYSIMNKCKIVIERTIRFYKIFNSIKKNNKN